MNKTILTVTVLLLGMTACQLSAEKEVAVPLKEVDMYADYPMKQLDIGELAEVTYLPLDRKLNSKGRSYHNTFIGSISESHIVSHTFDGDVEVFDHAGERLHHFNHQQKEKEGSYKGIGALLTDEKNGEIWILDYDLSFKVYTMDGTYRRKLKLPASMNAEVVKNWSADSLLCYDDYLVSEGLSKNPHPFYLFSKKDGGIRKLTSYRVPNRISHSERFVLNLGGMNPGLHFTISTSPLAVGGGRAVLAEYAKDTVFCLEQGKVSPLFVRKPSVFASLPFVLGSADFVTSRYLFFGFTEKSRTHRFYRDLLYDFETGEVCTYQLQTHDFEPWLSVPVQMWRADWPSNWLVSEMTMDKFLQYHREGKLSGKAAEAIERIKETDTVMLILYRFHQ